MKKYDRVKKEWVSEEELGRRTKARQKTCKGGKEHDYVEVLPYGAEATAEYKGSTEQYYDAEKKLEELADKLEKSLLAQGIVARLKPHRWGKDYRRLMCSVCHKQTTKSV